MGSALLHGLLKIAIAVSLCAIGGCRSALSGIEGRPFATLTSSASDAKIPRSYALELPMDRARHGSETIFMHPGDTQLGVGNSEWCWIYGVHAPPGRVELVTRRSEVLNRFLTACPSGDREVRDIISATSAPAPPGPAIPLVRLRWKTQLLSTDFDAYRLTDIRVEVMGARRSLCFARPLRLELAVFTVGATLEAPRVEILRVNIDEASLKGTRFEAGSQTLVGETWALGSTCWLPRHGPYNFVIEVRER